MNIYRESNRRVPVGIFVGFDVASESRKSAKSEVQSRIDAARDEAERRKRKPCQPLNVPLPRTFAWAATLPPDVRPHALIRSYPRITNNLALGWDDVDATHAYFGHLVKSTRTGRRGFPEQMMSEILALYWHYVNRFPYMASETERSRSRLAR